MLPPNNYYNNNQEIDMLAVLSILLGLQNLQENREQSLHNDVQTANNKQAEYLLKELTKRFDEQNVILKQQNEMLESIMEQLVDLNWRSEYGER